MHLTGETLNAAGVTVDVRTPAEFAKGAVAGAFNIPLFTDHERAEVGTIYKRIGRHEAVEAGMEFVGGRLAEFVQAFEPFRDKGLVVYCARGGMRSAAVTSLLAALGHQVSQLPGGYKAYRNYVLEKLNGPMPPRLLVLHGQTGVGKTLLLHRLANTLDLEGLARHRSSLFGAVGLQPRTQQQFEAHLMQRLERLDHGKPVWVEGESRKVGNAILPGPLRQSMQAGTCVLVTASLSTRIRRIIAEYGGKEPATLAQLEVALRSLNAFFGNARTEKLAGLLRRGELEPVVETLLLEYYDPRYRHGMQNYQYALELDSENLEQAAATLNAFWQSAADNPPDEVDAVPNAN